MKLDIACGKNKHDGYVGIDIDKDSDADILADALKLPFEESSFSHIKAYHILEHLDDTFAFFDELYRVSKKKRNN